MVALLAVNASAVLAVLILPGLYVSQWRFRAALAASDPAIPSMTDELLARLTAPWTFYTRAFPDTIRHTRLLNTVYADPALEALRRTHARWVAALVTATFLCPWFLAAVWGLVAQAPLLPVPLWLALAATAGGVWIWWIVRGRFGFRGMLVRSALLTAAWVAAALWLLPTGLALWG